VPAAWVERQEARLARRASASTDGAGDTQVGVA